MDILIMDNLLTVLKTYDEDEDGFLTKDEFIEFCKDIEYIFTEQEQLLFNLNNDNISYDEIMNAINYQPNNFSDEQFLSTLKTLDKDNSGKIFVPELINILKHSKLISDNNKLDELILNLPIEDHYLLYNKIV